MGIRYVGLCQVVEVAKKDLWLFVMGIRYVEHGKEGLAGGL